MANDPLIALELGTANVRVLVGDVQPDGTLRISNAGESEARGMRKGEVVDTQAALGSLREAIEKAEQSGDLDIGYLSLIVSGAETEALISEGHISITDVNNRMGAKVTTESMDRIMTAAGARSLPKGRKTLHSLPRTYKVDGRPDRNPEGAYAETLTAEALVLHGKETSIDTLRRMVENDLEIDCAGVYFSALCAAEAVLSDELKSAGVLLIDLGAGTTDYILYQDGLAATAGSLSVGGDHIVHDMTVGLNISRGQAEQIKVKDGSAIIDTMSSNKAITVPVAPGYGSTMIKKAALHTIINARVDEIFRLIRDRVQESGFGMRLGGGVILVGGGACMSGITDLARQVFSVPAHIGKVQKVACLPGSNEGVQYAVSAGCLLLAQKDQAANASDGLIPAWLKRMMRKHNG
jgi:cell division protein FtsA